MGRCNDLLSQLLELKENMTDPENPHWTLHSVAVLIAGSLAAAEDYSPNGQLDIQALEDIDNDLKTLCSKYNHIHDMVIGAALLRKGADLIADEDFNRILNGHNPEDCCLNEEDN